MAEIVPLRPTAPPTVELLVETEVDLTFVATASDRDLVATIEGDIQAAEDLRDHIFRHVFRASACFEELYRRDSQRAASKGEKLHRRTWLSGKFAQLFPGVSKTTYYLYRKISSPENQPLLQEFLNLVDRKAALAQSPQGLGDLSGTAGHEGIDLTKIPDRPSIRGFNRFIDLKRTAVRPQQKPKRATRKRKKAVASSQEPSLASAIAGLQLDAVVANDLMALIQAEAQYDRLLPHLDANAPILEQLQASRRQIRTDIAAFVALLKEGARPVRPAAPAPAQLSADDFYG